MKKEYSIRSLNCIEEEIQDKKTVWKQYIRGKADISSQKIQERERIGPE